MCFCCCYFYCMLFMWHMYVCLLSRARFTEMMGCCQFRSIFNSRKFIYSSLENVSSVYSAHDIDGANQPTSAPHPQRIQFSQLVGHSSKQPNGIQSIPKNSVSWRMPCDYFRQLLEEKFSAKNQRKAAFSLFTPKLFSFFSSQFTK